MSESIKRNFQIQYEVRIFKSLDGLKKFIIHKGLDKYQLIILYGGKKYGKS